MISPALQQLFDEPPRDFGPTPLWWWSGARVTRERLEWQMRRFVEGGVHNLVVINLAPAGPAFGARADDPAWFSEEWWARFTDACEIAQDLGMRLWLYDQIGFSGANVQGGITHRHPEAAGRALRARRTRVVGGDPGLLGTESMVGAYDVVTGERLTSDGAERVAVPDGTQVQLVTSVPTAFDYLDPYAVGLLIDTVHGAYERRVPQYLGSVIAGSFQDELPGTNSWTARFPQEFLSRRGYDLLDHIPALFTADFAPDFAADRGHAAKVRADYYAVRAELTEEALFKPLGNWHTERGMLLGADQSNPARAGNPTQATQIYTDYFRTHRWYSAVGSDHEGDSKVHSSMAHLYGHDRVWIEAFHSSGWGGTLEDTYDWLLPFLRSGANLYNPHAGYFGTAGGWFEWAPPSTDWRQPYWKHYPAFSRAVARIASVMTWGTYDAEVAVLHPTTTVQALLPLGSPIDHFGDGRLGGTYTDIDETQEHYLGLCGANNWFRTRIGALDREGISFDVIDDASVQRAVPADGCLRLPERDLRYSTVLLPSASVLEEPTARRLLELLDSGGRVVVVGRTPSSAAGMAGDDAVVAALAAHPRLERVPDAATAARAVRAAAGHATGDVPLLVRRRGDIGAAFVTGAFPNASAYRLRESSSGPQDDHDFDPARYALASTVRVKAHVAEAEVWNPATGTREPARCTVSGSCSTIEVPLDGAPAAIVVWREGEPANGATASRPRTVTRAPRTVTRADPATGVDLSSGWQGRLVPTMDNTWGDMALPAGTSVADLQIWTLCWTEGEGEGADGWRPVRATYGNRVRQLPPVPAADAPMPLDADAVAQVLAGDRPLVPPGDSWSTALHSSSGGAADPGPGVLGTKGLIGEEFVRTGAPGAGEVVRVRTIVATDRLGEADLVLGAAAAKRWWWNGEELPGGEGCLVSSRLRLDRRLNVLEYELADPQTAPSVGATGDDEPLGSFYCLTRPGSFAPRPQFMRLPAAARPNGRVTYRAQLDAGAQPAEAVLVVGAATGVTVVLDGEAVARQEKVEYYESSWGASPMFFRHELVLKPGLHVLELTADSVQAADVVFADLVARTASGTVALVSGAGWEVDTGDWRGWTIEHPGRWAELQPCYAAVRPHPLHGTEWLTGTPMLGTRVDAVRSTDDVVPAAQRFRATLPAGTQSVTLPLAVPLAAARIGGAFHTIDGDELRLGRPLQEAAELEIVTWPTATRRGGAALTGPLVVRTAPAPMPLGDWRSMGLEAWSGAVAYSRTVDVPAGGVPVLDLGRVRGSVEVAVDGEPAGAAFCAPYRFPLPGAAGRTVQIEVTVHNTLAPYLHEATPTSWTFPSQLVSGLLGPVTLLTADPAEDTGETAD
ncbi:glycosyl hydrolase [Streptomyces sp. 3N207]|uniref:glycosyl hydrolase n=1 Tax=Streptomyces sp. 3N207 TaxID=3457417 RepID=UPI003FD10705